MPKIRVTDEIRDYFGQSVADFLGPLTLRRAILNALTNPKPEDESLSWTARRDIFELADKVAREDEVVTTGADLVMVMSRMPAGTSTLVVGRISEAMDNRPEIAAAEAEAVRVQDVRVAAEAEAQRLADEAAAQAEADQPAVAEEAAIDPA